MKRAKGNSAYDDNVNVSVIIIMALFCRNPILREKFLGTRKYVKDDII
jgi:hypothetical protein